MVINNKQEECHMRFRFIRPGEMKLAFPRGKVIYYPMRQVENNITAAKVCAYIWTALLTFGDERHPINTFLVYARPQGIL